MSLQLFLESRGCKPNRSCVTNRNEGTIRAVQRSFLIWHCRLAPVAAAVSPVAERLESDTRYRTEPWVAWYSRHSQLQSARNQTAGIVRKRRALVQASRPVPHNQHPQYSPFCLWHEQQRDDHCSVRGHQKPYSEQRCSASLSGIHGLVSFSTDLSGRPERALRRESTQPQAIIATVLNAARSAWEFAFRTSASVGNGAPVPLAAAAAAKYTHWPRARPASTSFDQNAASACVVC